MKTNTFNEQHTKNVVQPEQTKQWFLDRVEQSIYSFQVSRGYYISTKEQAEILYENQFKGRRYKDLL